MATLLNWCTQTLFTLVRPVGFHKSFSFNESCSCRVLRHVYRNDSGAVSPSAMGAARDLEGPHMSSRIPPRSMESMQAQESLRLQTLFGSCQRRTISLETQPMR